MPNKPWRAIHAQAADLASQLQGNWQPNMEKSQALAKKANRETNPLEQAIMGKMVFEFQKDKMIVHGPPGFTSDEPAVPYTVIQPEPNQPCGDMSFSSPVFALPASANGVSVKQEFVLESDAEDHNFAVSTSTMLQSTPTDVKAVRIKCRTHETRDSN